MSWYLPMISIVQWLNVLYHDLEWHILNIYKNDKATTFWVCSLNEFFEGEG